MDQREWMRHFLAKRRLTIPDKRPLYAYKCSGVEYAFIKSLSEQRLARIKEHCSFPLFEPVFCLFAAETWRREHRGGPWAWQTVFDAAKSVSPSHERIRDWVSKGLDWWRRPLLKAQTGGTEFLVTIACEGGLPLKLLHQDGAKLSLFFRELLTSYHHEQPQGPEQAEVLARHLALRLPQSLRHDVVFQLSGRLIACVADLQTLIGDVDDPIAALEERHPGWRDSLPLPIEDDTVEVLLRNLVRHAQALQMETASQIRWQRAIRKDGEHWRIEQMLELPERVTDLQIKRWSGWNQIAPRLRLLLAGPGGTEVVAVLSAIKQGRDGMIYRCEKLMREGARLIDLAAAGRTAVVISDGTNEATIDVAGSEGLGPLPWVFVERGPTGVLRWLGEGTAKTRLKWAFVVAECQDRWEVAGVAGHAEQVGGLVSPTRSVYRVTGQVTFRSGDDDCCRISCESDHDASTQFTLQGHYVQWVMNETPVYQGVPNLIRIEPDGTRHAIPSGQLDWRPVGATDKACSRNLSTCAGRVWIRCRDAEQGTVLFRRQLDILPNNFGIGYELGNARESGRITLSGLQGAAVRVQTFTGLTVCNLEDRIVLDFAAGHTANPSSVSADLSWFDALPIRILLPTPQQGGGFFRGGHELPSGTLVAVERLGGIRALAQGPVTSERYVIDCDIHVTEAIDGDLSHLLWLAKPLLRLQNGQWQLELFRIQEELASLLAVVPDINAEARVALKDAKGNDYARLRVARFDLNLQPDAATNSVSLSKELIPLLDDDWQVRITVEMFPLWNPSASPVGLQHGDDEDSAVWLIPKNLDPGPWWIIGRDGGWARFRPLLWVVQDDGQGVDDVCTNDIQRAVREPDSTERKTKLANTISALAADPENPNWSALFSYIRLTREHPANSLDVLREFIDSPAALALALFKASEEDFEQVGLLADQMPFSWYLIPVQCWLRGAQRHFDCLKSALSEFDIDGAILWGQFKSFRERAGSRLQFFNVLCDWLQEELFPQKPLTDSLLSVARRNSESLALLITAEEGEFRSRHEAEERWPQGPRVTEVANSCLPEHSRYDNRHEVYRSVLCAPAVAAHICLTNTSYSKSVLLELRRIRAFDTNWFDNLFAIHFCLGLAANTAVLFKETED